MRKSLLFTLMAGPGLLMAGKTLSPQQALERVYNEIPSGTVSRKPMKSQMPTLTVTGKDNFTGIYVFNNDESGFMIVSADDCACPLLGYSDTGRIDKDNMPPQLKGWMDFYVSQMEWAEKNGKEFKAPMKASGSQDKAAIAPLLKSKWNQGAPYNDDCPLDNGKRSVTGCVATAMAQAMYYHQWPTTGTGSHSYTWNGQQLSVDFGTTTYDWSAMTDIYDDNSTEAAKEAVAELMYSCGVSVDMNYSSDESGASSMSMASALYKYFGYDKSMTFPQRSFYGEEEWENMVYGQLSQNLPVLYCGQSYEGGHQFICDGYDGNHYFHFNWGWSGMSDGYFLLSALNPLQQGIGGSASDSGFNYDQGIVLNMKPAQPDSQTTPLIYCYGNFGTKADGSVALGSDVDFDGDYFNFACAEISGDLGIKLVDAQGNERYLTNNAKYNFGSFSGYGSYKIRLPEDLTEGNYIVTPVFRAEGSSEWLDVLCPLSGVQTLNMSVSDGEATFTDDITNAIEVSDFTLNTPIYIGKNFSVNFTMTNTGTTEYFGEYVMYLLDESGNKVAVASDIDTIDLAAGESSNVNYIAKFSATNTTESGTQTTLEPGNYRLALYTHFTHREIYVYPTEITLQEAPTATTLDVTSFAINDGNKVLDKTDVKFSGTVQCTEGYFAGRLRVYVFREDATSSDLSGATDYIFASSGESADFTAHVDISTEKGDRFFAVVYDGSTQISNAYTFEITSTGIEAVETGRTFTISFNNDEVRIEAPVAIDNVGIYSVDGRNMCRVSGKGNNVLRISVGDYAPGEYVVTATDINGRSAHVLKFVK